jgi:hypothetical protein
MRNRGPALGALAAILALSTILTAIVASGAGQDHRDARRRHVAIRVDPALGPFQGLGTWVDLYDDPAWAHPRRAVAGMAARGVRTLYLETSNFSRSRAFVFRDDVTRFVDAAHAAGVGIVAWYLPGLRDLALDERRAVAAIRFRTPSGHAFDGFGLDIEASVVSDPGTRSARVLQLSDDLRAAAGDAYPLGAIIPSPRRIDVTDPHYWPGFPYAELAATYDAILPMTYYTYRTSGADAAHAYVTAAVERLRRDVGNDLVPIHVIGGIANASGAAETRAFVRAVRERGVIGASFYTYPVTDAADWAELAEIPANPVGDPALPVRPGPAELGDVPGGDRTHPNEVVYRLPAEPGDVTLSFEAYDVQAGEVAVAVNWRPAGEVVPTSGWGAAQTISIPAVWLHADGPNHVSFVAAEGADAWGVRDVAVAETSPAPTPSPSPSG